MSKDVKDIRESPKSGLVILAIHLAMLCYFMYLMASGGALRHPIGVIIFVGLILWLGLCFYGIKEAMEGLRGKKPWPRAHNRIVHAPNPYIGSGPFTIRPKGRGYFGVGLSGIATLLLTPIFALTLLWAILVERDDRSFALFCAVALGFISFFFGLRTIQQYLKLRFLNRIKISVSAPPAPGSSFNVEISHPELHRIKRMAVDLVLEEVAIESAGEQSAWEKHFAATVPICRLSHKRASRGQLTSRTHVELPPGSTPSFKCTHNQLNWFFLVRLDLALWEGLEQRFPLTVLPADYANRNIDAPQNQTA